MRGRSSGGPLSRIQTIGGRLIGVTGLTVATSLIGFLLQVALAARFGAGLEVDAYLFAQSVPTALAGLLVAAMSYALVPALVRTESTSGFTGLLDYLALGILILMAMCGLAAMALQPFMLPQGAPLFESANLRLLILLGWCVGGVQIWLGLKVIQLNASRRPLTASLINLPPNIFALLALGFLGAAGILVVPAGLVIGTGVMALTAAILLGAPPGTWPRKADLARLISLAPALLSAAFGVSCFTAYVVVDAFWAPRAGPGVLSTLGFSQRLLIGIGSLIVAGPSAVLTPYFAARIARGDWRGFRRLSFGVAAVSGGSAGVAAIVLWLTAPFLVDAAFGRGAFDAGDVEQVTRTFVAMLPGFSAMIVAVIATRALYCLPNATWPAAVLGVSWVVVYFLASGAFHSYGASGLGAAFSISWIWLAGSQLVTLAWLSSGQRAKLPLKKQENC